MSTWTAPPRYWIRLSGELLVFVTVIAGGQRRLLVVYHGVGARHHLARERAQPVSGSDAAVSRSRWRGRGERTR